MEFGVPSPFEEVMSDVGRDHYNKGSSEFKGAGLVQEGMLRILELLLSSATLT